MGEAVVSPVAEEGGRGNSRFPVAETLKPRGVKEQSRGGAERPAMGEAIEWICFMRNILKTPSFVFGLLACIVTFHLVGILTNWYRTIFWFPMLLHLAGGVWLGALFFFLAKRRGMSALLESAGGVETLFLVLGFVALGGVFWELFEFGVDAFIPDPSLRNQAPYLADTMGDLAVDLIGGILLFAGVRAKFSRRAVPRGVPVHLSSLTHTQGMTDER